MANSQHQSREEQIAFHVQAGDYFLTLATVLDLFRQDMNGRHGVPAGSDDLLRGLTEDLVFLQQHYRIVGKN